MAATDDTDPTALEHVAVTVAREAADLARRMRDRVVGSVGHGLDTKSSATDVVTAGDRACEELVRSRLARLRPGDAVLGEEGGQAGEAASSVRWVVDPIDGTVNYTHGLPWYAVSLGAEVDGRAVAGAVIEPVSGRVWSAARGLGARRDGVALRVGATRSLDLAVVATGLGYDPARRVRQAGLIARIAGSIGDVRRTGCASLDLCAVAAGWVDAYYEHGLHRWDWCAAALIAQEAGATVRRPVEDGPDADGVGPNALLAAPPALAADLTALLAEHGAAEI